MKKVGLAIAGLALVVVILPRLVSEIYAWPRRFSTETAPEKPVAIVFGAGLLANGSPTPALEDRLATVALLYEAGKVTTILLSGDNQADTYNEPAAMQAYTVGLGVPEGSTLLDPLGLDTYDTCYRAYTVFGIQEAILVTTDFHLPRALYLCNSLGVDSVGVATGWGSSPRGPNYAMGVLREFPATLSAFWDIYVSAPDSGSGN